MNWYGQNLDISSHFQYIQNETNWQNLWMCVHRSCARSHTSPRPTYFYLHGQKKKTFSKYMFRVRSLSHTRLSLFFRTSNRFIDTVHVWCRFSCRGYTKRLLLIQNCSLSCSTPVGSSITIYKWSIAREQTHFETRKLILANERHVKILFTGEFNFSFKRKSPQKRRFSSQAVIF